jgi:hypothetical protein
MPLRVKIPALQYFPWSGIFLSPAPGLRREMMSAHETCRCFRICVFEVEKPVAPWLVRWT